MAGGKGGQLEAQRQAPRGGENEEEIEIGGGGGGRRWDNSAKGGR